MVESNNLSVLTILFTKKYLEFELILTAYDLNFNF